MEHMYLCINCYNTIYIYIYIYIYILYILYANRNLNNWNCLLSA